MKKVFTCVFGSQNIVLFILNNRNKKRIFTSSVYSFLIFWQQNPTEQLYNENNHIFILHN